MADQLQVKPGREVFVAREADIPDGERKVIEVDGVEIGVFHVDRTFYAWRNDCPHQGGPVCQGRLMKRVAAEVEAVRW